MTFFCKLRCVTSSVLLSVALTVRYHLATVVRSLAVRSDSAEWHSAGVVRLRATVVELTPAGESLRGQRVFIVQQPARSLDAAGGVAALAAASSQLAGELAAWVEQVGH